MSTLRLFFNALPFLLLGIAVGQGPYGITNWQWWAWVVSIVISLTIRDEMNK